jgi:hypothetical protein
MLKEAKAFSGFAVDDVSRAREARRWFEPSCQVPPPRTQRRSTGDGRAGHSLRSRADPVRRDLDRLNDGVRSGDFAAMPAELTDDASWCSRAAPSQ